MTENTLTITEVKKELGQFIGNKENLQTLLATTFKGLTQPLAEQAMLEGMIRGFDIKNFLEKDVYATPFKDSYALVTSIGYSRKIGMRSGQVGKSEPRFELDTNGNVLSCSITVKRKVGDYVGDYSSLVFFKEYTTGKNLWASKPMTMIAKVAEMHALRMAFPEELSQAYIEEEYQQDVIEITPGKPDLEKVKEDLAKIKDLEALRKYYSENSGKGKEVAKLITEHSERLKQDEIADDINPENYPFPEE